MSGLDILDSVEQALAPKTVGVQEFAESSSFCNKPLYPRQIVLLKLIFLEEMTGEEEDVLTYWIEGGRGGNEIIISPNIRERRDFLRENGYKHFRETQLVGGRRSSKGFVTGVSMAKVMWDTLQLGDPGAHYGIDKEKDIYFSCVAGSEAQAKEFQYADLVSTVETCKAFEPYLVKSLETEFRVATNADLRKAQAAKARGSKIMRDIAKLRGKALAANAGTLRGSATMCIAQPLDAAVVTPTGWTTIGDLRVGSVITGSDGNPQEVVKLWPRGTQPAYRVSFSDGSSTICGDDHLWTLRQKRDQYTTAPLSEFRTDLLKQNGKGNVHAKWGTPPNPIVHYQPVDLPLDPYLVGALIGDGCYTGRGVAFYNSESDIVERVCEVLPAGHTLTPNPSNDLQFHIVNRVSRRNDVIRNLKALGIHGSKGPDKWIPPVYKMGSPYQRLSLLQGLLDTDGSVTGTSVRFGTTSLQLAQDVLDVVRSLGGYATVTDGYSLESGHRLYHVCISGMEAISLFRSQRKLSRCGEYSRYGRRIRRIVAVERVDDMPMQCITVSNPDGLYLTDHYIVTHNCLDEMAHMIPGESKASADQVYAAAEPSLDQFGVDGMMFLNSSPYTKVGMFYECFEANMRPFDPTAPVAFTNPLDMDSDDVANANGNPRTFAFEYPSWAQPLDAKILTPSGWTTMGDIQVGHQVVGRSGQPVLVTGINEIGADDVYRVTFSDGQSVKCSGEHLWEINSLNTKPRVMSTLEIQERLATLPTNHHFVPITQPVEYVVTQALPLSAYALGALLGDGCLHIDATPSLADFEPQHPVAQEVKRELLHSFSSMRMESDQTGGVFYLAYDHPKRTCGYRDEPCDVPSWNRGLCRRHYSLMHYRNRLDEYVKDGYQTNPIKDAIRKLGLLGKSKGDKFIPNVYRFASVRDRFALLQGLLDTDGEIATKNSIIFHNSSPSLMRDVRELVESLGGTTSLFYDTRREKPGGRLSIQLPDILGCPFRMPRKVERWTELTANRRVKPHRKIIEIEYVGIEEVKCISVDSPDGLYLTDHHVVTHNCLFEGYRKYSSKYKRKPRGKEFGKMITVSPDWDPEAVDEEGDPLFSPEDKAGILQARAKEAANPETYKVERRGKFAEVTDAYLNPFMVDQMYRGIPDGMDYQTNGDIVRKFAPIATNYGASASNLYRYKFHIDPSSTTAGFGFAIGHLEYFVDPATGLDQEHVVFDLIKRWDPANFPGKVIRWKPIIDEITTYATTFRPFEITLDQHQSAQPIQDLQDRLTARNIQCRVYERFATNELNWKRWEVFKTALYQGLIHAPYDEYPNPSPMGSGTFTSKDELKFLQSITTGGKFPRIDKQDIGPVQTKDMADPLHPSHDVLTITGWKPIAEVTTDDLVASLAADGRMTYHYPERTIRRDVNEDIFKYESSYIDFAVTGNHNMLVAQKNSDQLERVEARHLLHKERVPKLAMLDRKGPESFDVAQHMSPVIPRLNRQPVMYGQCQCGCGEFTAVATRTRTGRDEFKGQPKPFVERHGIKWTNDQDVYLQQAYEVESMQTLARVLDKTSGAIYNRARQLGLQRGQIGDRVADRPDPLPPCKTTDFAAFVGFWLGDGKKIKRNDGNHLLSGGYAVKLTQTKPEGIRWVDALMERIGWPYERKLCSNGETQWVVKSYELREYLYRLQVQNSHELRIPEEAWREWGTDALDALMEGLVASDGTSTDDGFQVFTNSSFTLMEDVQRLAMHLGRRGSPISLASEAGGLTVIKGQATKRNHNQWRLTVSDDRPFAIFKASDMQRESYCGPVYCLTMPLGTFLTRRHGVPIWIGNCVAEVVHTLIGNLHITSMRERLSGSALAGGSPGGYGIGQGGPVGGAGPAGISGYYSRREDKAAQMGGGRSSLTQGALGMSRRGRRNRSSGRW